MRCCSGSHDLLDRTGVRFPSRLLRPRSRRSHRSMRGVARARPGRGTGRAGRGVRGGSAVPHGRRAHGCGPGPGPGPGPGRRRHPAGVVGVGGHRRLHRRRLRRPRPLVDRQPRRAPRSRRLPGRSGPQAANRVPTGRRGRRCRPPRPGQGRAAGQGPHSRRGRGVRPRRGRPGRRGRGPHGGGRRDLPGVVAARRVRTPGPQPAGCRPRRRPRIVAPAAVAAARGPVAGARRAERGRHRHRDRRGQRPHRPVARRRSAHRRPPFPPGAPGRGVGRTGHRRHRPRQPRQRRPTPRARPHRRRHPVGPRRRGLPRLAGPAAGSVRRRGVRLATWP
jgi:hypothetical protein